MSDRQKYEDRERVQLRVGLVMPDGRRYAAGDQGSICPLTRSLVDCQTSGEYEINMDDGPSGYGGGLVTLSLGQFERARS